uniref:Holliday junction branch migration complex subunit RuvA n=1 Tax=candidate division WOR-3 bacterium TaxID=2052148 RepID=A0A7V3ZVE2_UNCW3
MIEKLKGKILEKKPDSIILDYNNLGLKIFISLNTACRIGNVGTECELYTYLYLQKNEITLYGFYDKEERRYFTLLTDISGVGPKGAINILSYFTPEEVKEIIINKKIESLKKVPGIGPKKAETIIFHLKDVFVKEKNYYEKRNELYENALKALMNLGLTKKEAEAKLRKVRIGNQSLEEIVKQALKE